MIPFIHIRRALRFTIRAPVSCKMQRFGAFNTRIFRGQEKTSKTALQALDLLPHYAVSHGNFARVFVREYAA